ncbi:PREDICTED: uncharacterized protein LOC109209150 [Nicotiana attenuata]|uniref:AT3G52170-like helix-turn-helix domain-containing protein n=1 Tax=Nicotiana attenuata TaxID=49451 RepID=A0A314KPB5_NICAT|nr:PREDICTED: uncharacterized protein LOC109209150 [Nicotiana attenuata]XP_019227897.1 PREDICTED: uncharacterized protein LOC109209150 [Nicotiana attenuata]XP_019227898.1 PREDICTED: uncharacterized protein LOC109209150 [Nicotiana attenuata]OIT31092.1 hypothetical protein A4A49_28937 [Nicotiana attenuata]
MQTIKGGWVGQTFALATYNDSGSRKTRIRRSKEERKTMVETFIKKYQTSNNGNFPSLNLTHKEVGGSFYTVREIVREIIQENKVLGPAKLPPGEQSDVQFAEQYPLGSISTEPQSLSLSEESHVMSTFAPIHYMGKSEADFGMNTQLDVAEAKVANDGPQTSTRDFNERFEQSDESYIIDSESDHQINKDEVSYSSGINGFDYELRNEQMVGDYETTEENEISGKSDLLDDFSVNHQNTNSRVLESFEIISDPVNESLSSGLDACHPTVKEDETYKEPISTESVVAESLNVESGTNELEASKAKPLKTIELLVEQFPLRPISKKIDDLDSGLNETVNVAKTSEETEIEQDIITSYGKDAQLINEPVEVMVADPISEKSSTLRDDKAGPKVRDASLEISSASEERATVATNVIVKASSTVNGTVNASSPMLNETFDSTSNNGTSKKLATDELIEAKGKASVQLDSSQQKGGHPPLDRIHLETWKGASAKSKEHETNPLLALLKACITAFVKFWTEE